MKVLWPLLALAAAKKALITEYTKAKDVMEFEECRNITSKEINLLLDPFACRGFKATCLSQFNIREINGACKDRMNPYEIAKLSVRKFEELIGSEDPMNIACFPVNLSNFHFAIGRYPKQYLHLCRTDRRWLKQFSGMVLVETPAKNGTTPRHINDFLVPENLPGLSQDFFDYIPDHIQDDFSPSILQNLTPEQFGHLNQYQFFGTQIKSTPAANFSHFPEANQLYTYNVTTLNLISVEQARNWGRDPKELPAKNPARRTFYLTHPCTYVKPLLYRFRSDDVIKAIKQRCRPLWKKKDFPNQDIGRKSLWSRRLD